MDVAAWLRGLGLERYAPAFRDNDVDGEVLPELTSDDLISIGVASVGHRRKLLAAIASLNATPPDPMVMAAPRDAPAPAGTERRQLTVLFCDLVGSTALSSQLDPEDLREVTLSITAPSPRRSPGFDGFVAKYCGRGHTEAAEEFYRKALSIAREQEAKLWKLRFKSVVLKARFAARSSR